MFLFHCMLLWNSKVNKKDFILEVHLHLAINTLNQPALPCLASLAWTFCLSLVASGPKCVSARSDRLNIQTHQNKQKTWNNYTTFCNLLNAYFCSNSKYHHKFQYLHMLCNTLKGGPCRSYMCLISSSWYWSKLAHLLCLYFDYILSVW